MIINVNDYKKYNNAINREDAINAIENCATGIWIRKQNCVEAILNVEQVLPELTSDNIGNISLMDIIHLTSYIISVQYYLLL